MRWLLTAVVIAGAALGVRAPLAAQDVATHLLVVTGLSGEDRFARAYREWAAALVKMAERQGVAAANIVWLAERADVHPRVRGTSRREEVERELRALAARADRDDRVLILLFGHGSWQNGETRINLPGPDINGRELAALLEPLRTQRVAVVNAASASGGFIQDLAAPNRIVITATRSGMERNETVFGAHFTAALTGTDADTDRDGRVSLLEAFEYARQEVEREYQRGNRLRTEHAVLDGVGDGRGVSEIDGESPHARLAATFFVGGGAAAQALSPELRRLHAEKERIEAEIAALRARRDSMSADAYDAALETLLVELSLNAREIRRLGGS
jgi:hypothetical protein